MHLLTASPKLIHTNFLFFSFLYLFGSAAYAGAVEEMGYAAFENYCLRLGRALGTKALETSGAVLASPDTARNFLLPQTGVVYILNSRDFEGIVGYLDNGGCTLYSKHGDGIVAAALAERLNDAPSVAEEDDGSERDIVIEISRQTKRYKIFVKASRLASLDGFILNLIPVK